MATRNETIEISEDVMKEIDKTIKQFMQTIDELIAKDEECTSESSKVAEPIFSNPIFACAKSEQESATEPGQVVEETEPDYTAFKEWFGSLPVSQAARMPNLMMVYLAL